MRRAGARLAKECSDWRSSRQQARPMRLDAGPPRPLKESGSREPRITAVQAPREPAAAPGRIAHSEPLFFVARLGA
jgi:hypothetical protein